MHRNELYHRIASQVIAGLVDLVYPPCCLVCGERLDEGVFCEQCTQGIKAVPPPFCDRCGAPISPDRRVCGRCEQGPGPPYEWSQALGQYTGTLREAIHRLKYNGKRALAEPLGMLLEASIDSSSSPLIRRDLPNGQAAFDVVVPVPLDAWRMRRRGFNQAERIARVVARERGWRVEADSIVRVRRTRSQTALAPDARIENVRGAFAARSSMCFAGRTVLIVDDVVTTGSTVTACADAARSAGATRICVVALARGL